MTQYNNQQKLPSAAAMGVGQRDFSTMASTNVVASDVDEPATKRMRFDAQSIMHFTFDAASYNAPLNASVSLGSSLNGAQLSQSASALQQPSG